MNCIKTESDDTVCRGCLSRDRRLLPLANNYLYFSLLEEKQRIEAIKKPYIEVCWECNATLRRLQLFRAQACRAHTILEDCLRTPTKDTLSRLTVKIKDKYDACFEDTRDIQQATNRLLPTDNIKHETSNVENKETDHGKIKVETTLNDLISCLENPREHPKKRKAKTKATKHKRRKVSIDDDIVISKLKVDKSIKSASIERKDCKDKTQKGVEIEICNVNIINNDTDEKIEVKVECLSDNIDDCLWMDDSAFVDDTRTIRTKKKNKSGSEYSYKAEKGKKDDKKRIFTFKKTVMKYSPDVLSYFTEVEMSEDEVRVVLANQPELVNKLKPYQCEFCGVCFKQKKTLDGHVDHSHRKAKHKDHIKKEEPDPDILTQDKCFLYRCTLCDRMVKKAHTQHHLQEHHRHKYHCLGCTWSKAFFWSKEDHAAHWQAVHAQLVCDLCKQTRRNTHDMERHMLSKEDHAAHWQAVHAQLVCDLCKQTRRNTHDMECHMLATHLPIKCPQCPRVYSKWKYYRQHQKLVHPVLAQEPPELRYCVECDMQFPSIMAYKMHVMNQHRSTPKKRWPCPACDKTLNNKDTMKKHYALFHSDKTSYQCQHCGKYLSSKCSLQHHMNSHLNIKLPKDKLCSVCGRGFSTKRMLRFHTYTHTGERPYACPHCPAAFTQPNPLRVHARKQHPHLPVCVQSNPAKKDK